MIRFVYDDDDECFVAWEDIANYASAAIQKTDDPACQAAISKLTLDIARAIVTVEAQLGDPNDPIVTTALDLLDDVDGLMGRLGEGEDSETLSNEFWEVVRTSALFDENVIPDEVMNASLPDAT